MGQTPASNCVFYFFTNTIFTAKQVEPDGICTLILPLVKYVGILWSCNSMNLILLGTKGGLSLLQGHVVKFVHVGRREGHNLDQNCERCQAQLV